ncbi:MULTISPECIES: glycosyltransferase [unclassified Yoonia]|uniref:glycosyltransferase n=1 Tax=unclassified Yoonia TaxID=2629118 RepID=UPI002AFFBF55|nr:MULTISPECIES: glycosyltransferase [unclassified Yoonia]
MLDFIADRAFAGLPPQDASLVRSLLAKRVLDQRQADRAIAAALRMDVPLTDVLLRDCSLPADLVARHLAKAYAVQVIDPARRPPDAALVAIWGARDCLRRGLLPWRSTQGTVTVLTTCPARFALARADLEQRFGAVRMGITTEAKLTDAVTTLYGPSLAAAAESCVPAAESCRNWNARRAAVVASALLAVVVAWAAVDPSSLIVALSLWAIGVLSVTTLLKVTAAIIGLRAAPRQLPPVAEADLPVITMLVPLYREKAIASHLLVRLAAVRYPRALLDVCLVLEEDDATTRATLARTTLPGWIRAITVPPGRVKTKPRALNYALPFARGSIIGVWDAEDAPAPDQLHVVARYFAQSPPQVACLQGVLDYYNTGTNWLTRCFTIEYAAWFRVVLPGLAQLGLVVPLGGTTLFFRRAVLEDLGAWDAHNVTEDADLGLRLARRGYTTELIPTVTMEEANGRAWPWVKQRARWLKGYAITYGVHMRNPARLLHDLGLWQFIGVQVLFLGTLSLFALMPLFWSLWLIPLGVAHPLHGWLSAGAFWAMTYAFFAAEVLALLVNLVGLHKAGKLRLWGWALTLPIYFPLGTLAAYRGLTELATRPFYWDKTAHGVVLTGLQPPAIPPPRPLPHPVSAA